MATNADIIVKIVGKDEVTPVIKNIEGSVTNLSKMFQGFSTGNLTQSMSGLTGLSQTIQNIGNSMGGLGKGFEGLGGKITEAGGALKAFAGSSAGLAVTIGAGIAVAVGAVGIGLAKMSVDLMQFASSEEKAVAQTKHTLDQMGKSNEFEQTMQNIAKHEASSRFESEELNKAYVQLLTTTKDTAKANDWLALSMDIASKKGLDLYQVSKTLSRVVAGEARAGTLSSLGIDIDETELEKFKTNADKAKYLYTELMETFEGSAQVERDTGAGALENIGKQVDNIKEKLGLALLEGLKPLMESIGSTLMNIVQSEGFKSFTKSITTLASSFGNATIKATDLLAKILGFGNTQGLILGVSGAFEKISEVLVTLSRALDTIITKIEQAFSKFSDLKNRIGNSSFIQTARTPLWDGKSCNSGLCYSTLQYNENSNAYNSSMANMGIDYNSGYFIPVNDALITKDGKVIEFNPNDNILAFQEMGGNINNSKAVEEFNEKIKAQTSNLSDSNEKLFYFNQFIEQASLKFKNLIGYIGFGKTGVVPNIASDTVNSEMVNTSTFNGSTCDTSSTTYGLKIEAGGYSYEYKGIPSNVPFENLPQLGATWDEKYQRARNAGMTTEQAITFAGGRTIERADDRSLRDIYNSINLNIPTLTHQEMMEEAYKQYNKIEYNKTNYIPYLTNITGTSSDETEKLRDTYLYPDVANSLDVSQTNLAYLTATGLTYDDQNWKTPSFASRYKICNECGTKNDINSKYCRNPNCYFNKHINNNKWTYESEPNNWNNMNYSDYHNWKNEYSFNDILITKKGDFVKFSPDDNIIATKDGFKNKQDINLTFNIYESKNPRELVKLIMQEINRVVRIG